MMKTAICWKDCIKLLSGCMTQYNASLAVELCNKLTPESFVGGSCVSLDDYLTPQLKTVAVVAPCRYNNCRTDQVCVVDHQSPVGYSCLPGIPCFENMMLNRIKYYYSTLYQQVVGLEIDPKCLASQNRGCNYPSHLLPVLTTIVMKYAIVTAKENCNSVTALHCSRLNRAVSVTSYLVRYFFFNRFGFPLLHFY